MEYGSATKRNGIVPFAEMWMDLETARIKEVRKRKTMLYNIIYMWNLKRQCRSIYLQSRNRCRSREQTYRYQEGVGGRLALTYVYKPQYV